MNLQQRRDYQEMSELAADHVLAWLDAKPDALLCAATGHSPTGLYAQLAAAGQQDPPRFSRLRLLKLDEWLELPRESPGTCESYLRERLMAPLRIPAERYLGFDSSTAEPELECTRIEQEIRLWGGIDACILGLGQNGHLGFNEPGAFLQPACHVATLAESTRAHAMLSPAGLRPTRGVTLGMRTILQSRILLLLVTGNGKNRVYSELLAGKVTTHVPATFVHLHQNAHVIVDMSCI